MLRKKNDGIEWLEFELLADEPHIAHGVFLRHGGVSQGPYSSLNVLNGKGDDDTHVAHNRSRIIQCMELQHLITCDQVHGTHVVHVEELRHEFPDSDGLVTQVKNWGLERSGTQHISEGD
jgi:copper oxidase (laccase) domain-containing protein